MEVSTIEGKSFMDGEAGDAEADDVVNKEGGPDDQEAGDPDFDPEASDPGAGIDKNQAATMIQVCLCTLLLCLDMVYLSLHWLLCITRNRQMAL